jgi:membrane protein DedA with SNARE-associated domain
MYRAAALKLSLSAVLALVLHHKFHGPPIDYAGLALAAGASWIGVPGPGEPVLIAAGVFAAKHKLDLASVLVAAWFGANAGGIGGWLIGWKAGRLVMTTRGPFLKMRLSALQRGDDVFKRYPVLAIVLAPSWIAGIHHVRAPVYLAVNAAGAAAWATGIGLGAYFVGPSVVELVQDLGLVLGVALGLLVAGGVVAEIRRRRRKRSPTAASSPSSPTGTERRARRR